jgi:crossover junction endonuclease MUS81
MNSEIILEIDYRESAIIKHFEYNKPAIPYKISNLPVGDFIFKIPNEESIIYIIERKTILDLASSITDGRFREQKQRLLDSIGAPDKIIYVLEGNKNLKKYGSISKSIIDSSILNLIFKHQYKVIHTLSDLETYDTLISLYSKLSSKDFGNINSTQVKLIKKSDNTSNNIFMHMLSTIPGVSTTIAGKIALKYNTLPELIKEYDTLHDTNQKEQLLCNIQINKRKLGNALSKKIYTSLFNNNKEEHNKEECLLD